MASHVRLRRTTWLLGNGPTAWSLAVFDGMLGRPNDYYKLYLFARMDASQPEMDRSVADLAMDLFPRIAAYYSSSDADSAGHHAA